MGVVSGTGARELLPQDYVDQQIVDGLAGTAKMVYRLVLTLIGLGLFTVIAIGQPDAYLLNPASTVSVPTIGATTAKAILFFVPMLLIATRVYLQVYVDHWHALNTEADRRELELAAEVSPMRHPLLRLVIEAVLNLLVPAAMIALTWKAMALPHTWGVWLMMVTILVIAGHLIQLCRGLWGQRLACGGVLGVFLFATFALSQYAQTFREEARRPFDLRHVNLSRADLSGRDLQGADFRYANLQAAYLDEANLKNANFFRANLRDANLKKVKLQGARLDEAVLQDAILRGASLQNANLKNVKLSAADLSGANLSEADFEAADLSKANLKSTMMPKAYLARANLRDANLRSAIMNDAFLGYADLQGVDLRFVSFARGSLKKANLKHAILDRSDLREVSFNDANLQEAILYGANLEGADLSRADLRGANLRRANLQEAILFKVKLTQSILNQACLFDRAKPPEYLPNSLKPPFSRCGNLTRK